MFQESINILTYYPSFVEISALLLNHIKHGLLSLFVYYLCIVFADSSENLDQLKIATDG